MTTRLIEKWLPIAALGEESVRERRSMTALPPTYYLHVWWARRPLVASRAAVLAAALPEDADRERFMQVLGIHGDPVASRVKIENAKRTGKRFSGQAYSYPRAFSYCPSASDIEWFKSEVGRAGRRDPVLLDPTAGGGSIPFEALRLGVNIVANDLNPVAALILRATLDYPRRFGFDLVDEYRELADEFVARREARLTPFFPTEPEPDSIPTNYLWARTIQCPYCQGIIPLSPNWRLAPDGTGIRLKPVLNGVRRCEFEIVRKASEQSDGTVKSGDASCPFPDCGRVVDGDEIKRQAKERGLADQLFAVVYKQRIGTGARGGAKWQRGYRSATRADDVTGVVQGGLDSKLPEWEALSIIPTESIGDPSNYDRGHRLYGMARWKDLFSSRQLYTHCTAVEVFRELLDERKNDGVLTEREAAAFVYLSLTIDKSLNWNSRLSGWNVNYERQRSVFDSHGYKFVWAFAEMSPLVQGVGVDWTVEQTGKAIKELVELSSGKKATKRGRQRQESLPLEGARPKTSLELTCGSASSLHTVADGTVDLVVMDPPYYDNVMYAELSDFFYVWLKRTAGYVYPDLFRMTLTDKENEAVANPAKFTGRKQVKQLASSDYQDRMSMVFSECRRVLVPDGMMVVMFTHKATGAWDALASGLLDAGFAVTASWPVNTEFENAIGIKDKAAANSTVFLACRPRAEKVDAEVAYWEDVEPQVAQAVRKRVKEFQEAGIGGVDLYLACFGPALEEFSRYWPLRRGQPRAPTLGVKGRGKAEVAARFDPYAVTPEDALDAARREVKRWRLDQLTRLKKRGDLDPTTEWFVLAWDAYHAPQFPYDEGLRLARVVGVDLDGEIVGRIAEKKGSNIVLWDSAKRAGKSALGPPDGSRAILDALHHAAHTARTRTLDAARELLEKSGADKHPAFLSALEAVLEVLPVSKTFTKIEESGIVADAASDFDALEHLRRLAFAEKVDAPEQLKLWEGV